MKHTTDKKHAKKGQVTIFVIVGLLILITAGIVIFTTQEITKGKPNLDVPDVSLEAKPVIELINDCLDFTAKNGLLIIGRSGGSIIPPKVGYPVYQSEAVPLSSVNVPYWRYMSDCSQGSCEFSQQPALCKPSSKTCTGSATSYNDLPSIEEQLEGYIINHIDECIQDFQLFSAQYDVKQTGSKDVTVIFGDEDTSFVLEYPIRITSFSTGNTNDKEEFQVSLDVPLKHMYEVAEEIIDFSRETSFYEHATMQLINIYAGLDSKLPPIGDITFGASKDGPWLQPEVQEILQYDLLPFMGLITYINTNNYVPIREYFVDEEDEYSQYVNGIYGYLQPKTSDTIHPYSVRHVYTYEDIFAQVDNGATVIEAKNPISEIFPPLDIFGVFINDYRFKYFVSYPLLVQVQHEDALSGEGYTFQFAYEVNVRNNLPGYGNQSIFSSISYNNPSIANFEQLLEQNITVRAIDKHTGEPLEDVAVEYYCGEEYLMGSTRITREGNAEVTGRLPYCEFGGAIKYTRLGYLGQSIEYDNKEDSPNQLFEIELWPIKNKQVLLRKRSLADISNITNNPAGALFALDYRHSPFEVAEEVFLSVSREKETAFEDKVPLVGLIRQGDGLDAQSTANKLLDEANKRGDLTVEELNLLSNELNTVDTNFVPPVPEEIRLELVPGTYTATGNIIHNEILEIPYHVIEGNNGFLGIGSTPDVPLDPQNFTSWIKGGHNTTFIINEDQLYNDDPIVFYFLEMPLPARWPDIINWKSFYEYQDSLEYMMNPTFGMPPTEPVTVNATN